MSGGSSVPDPKFAMDARQPAPESRPMPRRISRAVRTAFSVALLGALAFLSPSPAASAASSSKAKAAPLFPADGIPAGWTVRSWNDVIQPAAPTTQWTVRNGILFGSEPRGSWLISEREYGDFVLDFEIRVPARGNAALAFRFPPTGDPAKDGFSLQLVDPRYYATNARPAATDLAGSLSKTLAPSKNAFKPDDWNRCRIDCRGPRVEITLNGQTIHRLKLDADSPPAVTGKPLKDRPLRGRLGFLEISRAGGQIQVRNAQITTGESAPGPVGKLD